LLAQARGHQLAETRKQLGLGQKQVAAAIALIAIAAALLAAAVAVFLDQGRLPTPGRAQRLTRADIPAPAASGHQAMRPGAVIRPPSLGPHHSPGPATLAYAHCPPTADECGARSCLW
jgi:hypothetical protein